MSDSDLIGIPPELVADLRAGRLEQCCRRCGRWEAASLTCSWCLGSIDARDWYRNDQAEARAARMPATAPADPPSEYMQGAAHWPSGWGEYPRQKAAGERRTPVKRAFGLNAASMPTEAA